MEAGEFNAPRKDMKGRGVFDECDSVRKYLRLKVINTHTHTRSTTTAVGS